MVDKKKNKSKKSREFNHDLSGIVSAAIEKQGDPLLVKIADGVVLEVTPYIPAEFLFENYKGIEKRMLSSLSVQMGIVEKCVISGWDDFVTWSKEPGVSTDIISEVITNLLGLLTGKDLK